MPDNKGSTQEFLGKNEKMRKYWMILILIIGTGILNGCKKEDDIIQNLYESEINAFEKVSVKGNLTVVFKNQSNILNSALSSTSPDYKVNISAPGNLRNHVWLKSENNLLTIITDEEVQLSDSIVVEVWSKELNEIRLERDQVAEFIGIFNQEKLTVVTEANSKLTLLEVQVDKLYCKTEGESELIITTHAEVHEGNRSYDISKAVQMNEYTLLVDNSLVVVGDSVKLENEYWTIYGQQIHEHFVMTYCDFKTEEKTIVDAQDALVKSVNISLEGQSEAIIRATEAITGTGEGTSILWYKKLEGVDLTGFVTNGGAEIIPYE